MQEKQRQVYDLLEITNRQFNECNALYHAVAQRCGLSDAAFWVLYALCTTHEPQTQNRMAAEWGQPKQTLNSAVAAMVKKGLVELCPGKGAHSGKLVTLTDEGRALAARTVEPVIASRAAGHDPSGPCRGRAELPPDPAVSGMLTAGV